MNRSAQGYLLWKAPVPKPLPRWVLYLCGIGFLGLGLLIGYAVIDVIRPMRRMWSDPVFYICIGSVAFFLLFGAWNMYCAINWRRLQGLHFYEHGLEIGEEAERKFMAYSELETLQCILARAPDAGDTALNAARAVVSLIAMNPAGIGRAMGEAMQEPVFSELVVKPYSGELVTFPLTHADHLKLAPIFKGR